MANEPQNDLTLIAQLDQAMASIQTLSQLIWSYYAAMREQGFSSAEALALTIDYQRLLFTTNQKGKH